MGQQEVKNRKKYLPHENFAELSHKLHARPYDLKDFL